MGKALELDADTKYKVCTYLPDNNMQKGADLQHLFFV